MSHQLGIPKAALNSLIQMVDYDAQVKPGMEVVILAHTDGLYGSDNWVDEQADQLDAGRRSVARRQLLDPLDRRGDEGPRVAPAAHRQGRHRQRRSVHQHLSRPGHRRGRRVPQVHRRGQDLVRPHVPGHRLAPDDQVGADAARSRHHGAPRQLRSVHDPRGQVRDDRPQRHGARRLHARSGAASRHPRHALQLLAQGCQPLHSLSRVGAPADQLQGRQRRLLLQLHAALVVALHGPPPGLGESRSASTSRTAAWPRSRAARKPTRSTAT